MSFMNSSITLTTKPTLIITLSSTFAQDSRYQLKEAIFKDLCDQNIMMISDNLQRFYKKDIGYIENGSNRLHNKSYSCLLQLPFSHPAKKKPCLNLMYPSKFLLTTNHLNYLENFPNPLLTIKTPLQSKHMMQLPPM